MSPELIALYAQIPLVGIFVFYVLRTRHEDRKEREMEADKARAAYADEAEKWRAFLEKQQSTFAFIISANTEALKLIGIDIKSIEAKFEAHDKATSEAIATMKERTAARAAARIARK